MKKTNSIRFSSILLLFAILFVSCNDESIYLEEKVSDISLKSAPLKSTISQDSKFEKFNYFKNKAEAGEDISKELSDYIIEVKSSHNVGTDYDYITKQVLAALNPDDYNCDDSNIPLSIYINSTISEWAFIDYLYWLFYGDYPTYDAIYFKAPGERQSFGVNGEYTNQLNRIFKDLKRFWDINSSDIYMFAMKGDTYKDIDRLTEIENLLYPGQSEEESRYYAELWNEIFTSDIYWGGDHPLFSFNAFALSTTHPFIQDRIVMGDGIMLGYEEIGLGDVAPQGILAHEFAHHIQFENGYFENVDPDDQPEATRRTELMADAYAAYYLTHKRGATLNWKRVQQFLAAFYNIGDCSFDNSGHHGTHEQRLAAAQWGYDLAKSAKKNGHIMSSNDFYLLFEENLGDIVNCASCIAVTPME